MSGKSQRFSATLYKVGILRCVDVPERVSRALDAGTGMGVVVTVRGENARTSLVSRGEGAQRLFLEGSLRKAARIADGSRVTLTLQRDDSYQDVTAPEDLARALHAAAGAWGTFETATPSIRRQLVEFVVGVKSAGARRRRVDKAVTMLLEMPRRRRR